MLLVPFTPKILAVMFLLFSLESCVSTDQKIIPEKQTNELRLKENKPNSEYLGEEDQEQKVPSKGESTGIVLQDHQIKTVDYLFENKEQKGLLVNHYMGSGKTILALSFCEKYPTRDVYILLPKFLKGHWLNEMKLLGVLKPERYHFIGLKELSNIENTDFSKSLVILDESHRFIELLNSQDLSTKMLVSKLYLRIQKAHKIMALTGTPIYSDPINLSYQINLVSGKKVIETNKQLFNAHYMKIDPTRSFPRGYVLESQVALNTFPTFASLSAFSLGAAVGVQMLVGIGIPLGLILFRNMYPIENINFRKLDAKKLIEITEKYVSFYDFEKKANLKDYPTKSLEVMKVPYTIQQYFFLLDSLDHALNTRELEYILRDQNSNKTKRFIKEYIELNTNSIQENLLKEKGYGRHIGNMIFEEQGKLYIPPKFESILETAKKAWGPVVIYSHYYENGLLLFYKYLKENGYGDNEIEILHPNNPIAKQDKVINNYNSGLTKFLLIHPEITEGISLKGTSQLHFLEVSINKASEEQIVGRAIRYKSHSHLAPEKRHVNVYVWVSTINSSNFEIMKVLRYNWYKRYSELNYYSNGGASGRIQLDKNCNLKKISPDQDIYTQLHFLDALMIDLKNHLKNHSIESQSKRKAL